MEIRTFHITTDKNRTIDISTSGEPSPDSGNTFLLQIANEQEHEDMSRLKAAWWAYMEARNALLKAADAFVPGTPDDDDAEYAIDVDVDLFVVS